MDKYFEDPALCKKVFESSLEIFELANENEYLKVAKYKRNPLQEGLLQKFKLYVYVSDEAEEKKIREFSENWHFYTDGIRNEDFKVYSQRDYEGALTGYYKIIEKGKNKDTSWIRYYKRYGK